MTSALRAIDGRRYRDAAVYTRDGLQILEVEQHFRDARVGQT